MSFLERIFKSNIKAKSKAPAVPSHAHVKAFDPYDSEEVNAYEMQHEEEPMLPYRDTEIIALPLLGRRAVSAHQRILLTILTLSLLSLSFLVLFFTWQSSSKALQVAAVGDALMQSQRLAKSVSPALLGNVKSFAEVKESANALSKTVQDLKNGDPETSMQAVGFEAQDDLNKLGTLIASADKNSNAILLQQKNLTQIGSALRTINQQSAELLEIAEAIFALRLEHHASATELSAVSQLSTLTQRIGKSSNQLLTVDGVSQEAVFLLGKDLSTFRDLAQGLLVGSTELRLNPVKDDASREQLQALQKLYEQTRVEASAILGNLQGLVSAREAQVAIVTDSESMRIGLQRLRDKLASQSGGQSSLMWIGIVMATLFALLAATGLAMAQVRHSRQRQKYAEQQQHETVRINNANQSAILRLMNELQIVAEGDLTQQATVTEDITGAVADSINYTVEELRLLVRNVQVTAASVAQTTAQVEDVSSDLLAASTQQLEEIRATGQSVLDMAARINDVSVQAQESASVAQQSLAAAGAGLNAVKSSIGGMSTLQDQIQDTSSRIKRLGESSQQIGEITELISDITDQTNVLALNAAIQAASAGEAGRGFSVVAKEVQRLAEWSADATRQISLLVKAIQTDTQDAVAAMEQLTSGVVSGKKMSDSAGAALGKIDTVSRRLADLILQIAQAATQEADSANVVANSIQRIFVVTEQTTSGTRDTAQQVSELTRIAEELRQSVSRFKIS